MPMTFNPPYAVNGLDEKTAIAQLYSYLYQMSEQLNIALTATENAQNNLSKSVTSFQTSGVKSAIDDNYQQVKALIIKSGEVLRNEMDIMVQQFGREYLAVSDFGTFQESLTNTITTTAEGVVQSFNYGSSLQQLSDTLSVVQSTQIISEQYIKIGVVKYDGGNPVVGVAVGNELTVTNGQITSANMYAVFTAERLSFYKNGSEMAYLSNNTLYVSAIELTDHMTLGHWRIDSANGFTIQWQ